MSFDGDANSSERFSLGLRLHLLIHSIIQSMRLGYLIGTPVTTGTVLYVFNGSLCILYLVCQTSTVLNMSF